MTATGSNLPHLYRAIELTLLRPIRSAAAYWSAGKVEKRKKDAFRGE